MIERVAVYVVIAPRPFESQRRRTSALPSTVAGKSATIRSTRLNAAKRSVGGGSCILIPQPKESGSEKVDVSSNRDWSS
jgi:hypothetical protein